MGIYLGGVNWVDRQDVDRGCHRSKIRKGDYWITVWDRDTQEIRRYRVYRLDNGLWAVYDKYVRCLWLDSTLRECCNWLTCKIVWDK